ncbi:hypothetical protein EEL30_00185 (plasmid) [Brevibacillus laterosporus]|uniref:Uncharacterized protein n=1 Tax=Brevibacillus laterosporus TaxID=1465 RepID=A0A518V1S0_BRELA|nr:hypothetical protein EEL30_00185 [Brevibacillus laterosporus]
MCIDESMSVMQIRLALTEKGWGSEDRITKWVGTDGYGYSIWFQRWNWHGVRFGNKICIHGHTDDLTNLDCLVYKTAAKALKAWEDYKDAIPCQMSDGTLKKDLILTHYFETAKERELTFPLM